MPRGQLYNRDGSLTAYALTCGHIEKRGNDEAGVRLEQCRSKVYRVTGHGRWLRHDIYRGPSLTAARRAFRSFDYIRASRETREAILAAHEGAPVPPLP